METKEALERIESAFIILKKGETFVPYEDIKVTLDVLFTLVAEHHKVELTYGDFKDMLAKMDQLVASGRLNV